MEDTIDNPTNNLHTGAKVYAVQFQVQFVSI